MSNQEMNQKLYDFVRRWRDSAQLMIGGVNLADCMAYDVLSVVGRQIVNSQPQPGERAIADPDPSQERITP